MLRLAAVRQAKVKEVMRCASRVRGLNYSERRAVDGFNRIAPMAGTSEAATAAVITTTAPAA